MIERKGALLTCSRYHDFSAGHRVVGHENKCRGLHGHNYRVTFVAQAFELDDVGRVVDFSVLKSTLCQWLEDNWDHKLLLWHEDPVLDLLSTWEAEQSRTYLAQADGHPDYLTRKDAVIAAREAFTFAPVPFNPTAENMARYLLEKIGPELLADEDGVKLIKVIVEETRKCSAAAEL